MANDNETVKQIAEEMQNDWAQLYYSEGTRSAKGEYPDVNCIETKKVAKRILAAHKREMADEKRISDAVIQSMRDKKMEMAGEIAAKEADIAKLNRKVYEYEKLLASSPIGLIYQLGICNRDGDVMNGIGILFTNEAERAKMPRVGHGDKFYVVHYKEREVPSF